MQMHYAEYRGLGSELQSQKQEESVTEKPEVKSATSVNVVELNTETETDIVCLKIYEVQS